jgi:hypothetical protein
MVGLFTRVWKVHPQKFRWIAGSGFSHFSYLASEHVEFA